MNGKLSIKDRRMRFGFINVSKCYFCENCESMIHLFFACDALNHIWRDILMWMGIRRNLYIWNREKMWMIKETKIKVWKWHILKIAIAEAVYEIWRSRNEKIFSQRDKNPYLKDKIIRNIVARCTLHRELENHVNTIHP